MLPRANSAATLGRLRSDAGHWLVGMRFLIRKTTYFVKGCYKTYPYAEREVHCHDLDKR